MEQHLEIFKHLEELYHGDTTDEAIEEYARMNSQKMERWKEAFEGYYLRDVLDAIDEYFAHKNNKTPPRIAQIKALMNVKNIHAEEETSGDVKKAEPDYDLKYMKQDNESGDMNWLVPHYTRVLGLIRQDKFPFVQNIYHPTYEEFRECMKRWCQRTYGKMYFCVSQNQIDQMTTEQRRALEVETVAVIRGGLAVKSFGENGVKEGRTAL